MKRFDVSHQTIETDINGDCQTFYSLDRAVETSLIIKKYKDFSTCINRYKHHSILQTTPYVFRSNYQAMPLIKTRNSCNISVDHHVYNKIECEDVHIFQPFSNGDSGAKTITRQVFTLVAETNTTTDPLEIITRRESLLFDHDLTPKPVSGELKASRDLIKQMCRLNMDEVQQGFPDAFTKFIHTARLLSYPALTQVYTRAPSMCSTGRKHVLDALPLLGSNAAIAVMRDLILDGTIPKDLIHEWLFMIAFIPRPDNQTLSYITPLLTAKEADAQYYLSISSVVHTYCKWNANCKDEKQTYTLIKYLENMLMQGCQHKDKNRMSMEKTLIAIKSLANIGVPTSTIGPALTLCIEDEELPMEIRTAAIEAHRRLPCEEKRSYFLELYRNHATDPEMRIASYLQVMRCVNYNVIKTIKHTLQTEEINQVGSFVWSHLHNLLKSSIPSRVEIQGLLQDRDLDKKFSSDIRKFSHNYEGSVFFDEYNAGGNYESNVIFSPKSYIPRSANLNVTVDLFGHSINVFEVAGRMEGFEHYIEALFGPKGPMSSKKINEQLQRFRFIRSAENDLKDQVKQIPNIIDNNFDIPKASFGFKVFGNELKHHSFIGDEEIQKALASINPVERLKQLLSGKEVHYNKATVFLDTDYIVPTSTGLPINLNAVGTAAVNLKLSGSLKGTDFMKTGELDVKGNIRPSVSMDVVGSLGVDAYYAGTGIKLKTNLYTSSAIDGHLKVRGKRLVSLSFNVPKEKTEIITAQSELVVMHGEEEELQRGIEKGRVEKHMCSWPSLDQTLGLNFCGVLQFPNATHQSNASKFLLNGPTKFGLSFQKADPSATKYLLEYKWETVENGSTVSLVFDTPGSLQKREMSAKLNLHPDSQNLTVLIQSAKNKYEALGKYKNTPEEKYINFSLDINGKKHVDAELSLKTVTEKYGLKYYPRLYLAINGTRIAELSGTLRWIEKKGISQCEVNLEFQTRKLETKLTGYVKRSDASIYTTLKLDYKFKDAKPETVTVHATLTNRVSKTLSRVEGSLQLESSAYPQYNFISSMMYLSTHGHFQLRLDINYGLNIKDERNKLTLNLSFTFARTYESNKVNFLIEVTKPISDIHLKFSLNYHAAGADITVRAIIRYTTGKDIFITLNLKLPRSSLMYVEAKLNVTLPSFHPMVIELQLHEKTPNEYNIDISAVWFSGHNLTARGLYQDRSTSKQTSHSLKLLIKSPSFQEIAFLGKYIQDEEELKLDLQAEHNKEKYSIVLKHASPSSVEFETYVEVRVKSAVYSVTTMVNLLQHRQILIELHLDQIRDIHLALRSLNEPDEKEVGVELKWDANRDPGQKIAASIYYYHPEAWNYSGNFMVSYPGRTIKGSYLLAFKGSVYNSYARLEWNPTDAIHMTVAALYEYEQSMIVSVKSELMTPFEDWKKTSLAAGIRHEGNLFQANGSVHWQDNQNIALNLFGDYFISDDDFSCEFNASIISTIPQVSSLSGSLFHRESNNKYDTNIHIQYYPEKVVSVKSTWQLEENSKSTNLTGKVSLISPYTGYRDGVLICRMHVSSDWDIKGAADLTLDRRKYTFAVDGYVKRITNNMLVFNITTPLENYSIITGRFGFSQEKKHLVAEIKAPAGAIGIEILFSFYHLRKFNIKFFLATPIEFLQTAVLIAKLNDDMVDFRCGWNNLVIGFSGLWHYIHSTDFEYRYRIYTPIEGFHENGLIAKLIKIEEGVDLEVGLNVGDSKLGIKVQGANKPRIPEDLKLVSKKLENEEDYNDEEDDIYAINWKGLVEIDTLLYPTFKGTLDIDTKDSLYTIEGTLTLPDGTAVLYDELNYEDYFTISNKLQITTPCEKFKEVRSNFDYRIDFGVEYGTSLDLMILSDKEWIKSGISLNYGNYTAKDGAVLIHIRSANFTMFSPYDAMKLFSVKGQLEVEDNTYRTNLILATEQSQVAITGYLEAEGQYIEASLGLALESPSYTIPSFRITGKKEFTQSVKKIELMFERLEPALQVYKIEGLWSYDKSHLKTSLKIETPHITPEMSIYFSKKDDGSLILDLLLSYSPQYTYKLDVSVQGNDINAQIETPLEQFRKAHFSGNISPASDIKTLTGTLNIGDKTYTVDGHFQSNSDVPFMMETKFLSSSKDDHILIKLNIGKTVNGHTLLCFVQHGKDNFELQGDLSFENILNSSFNVKVTSTLDKSFSLSGKIYQQDNGNVTVEVIGNSAYEGLEKIRIYGSTLLQKDFGNVKASFDVTRAKGGVNCDWVWLFTEDMKIHLDGFYSDKDLQKHGVVNMFYKNPGQPFGPLSLGLNVEFDHLWMFGTNVSLSMISTENLDMLLNLELPPPQHEIHTFHVKLFYTDKLESLLHILKYSTLYSKKTYGVSAKINTDKEKMVGNMCFEYGTGDIKHVNNTLRMQRDNNSLDLAYVLTLPQYEEDAFLATASLNKLPTFSSVRGDLFYPASRNIARAQVDFKGIYNMNGTIKSNTPFQGIPYAGINFKTATESLYYQRFVEVFWPNKTAVLNSEYKYEMYHQVTDLTGLVLVEIPLTHKHTAQINYGYKQEPLNKTGYATIKYNDQEFLEGKYKCDSQSSAGFDKDVINIEIENDYFPLGIFYDHEFRYSGGMDGTNLPTIDFKRAEIFKLHNETFFNLTGELNVKTTMTGQEMLVTVIHSNRVVKLKTDYDFLDHEFKQHSTLSLDPNSWASYDLTIVNKTTNEKEEEHVQINFAYPRRNFTLIGYYQLANNSLSSEMNFEWDKQVKKRSVGASFDWKRLSTKPNKQHAVFCIKHPSFVRDVTLDGLYFSDDKDLFVLTTDLVYSNVSDKKLSLSGKIKDNSQGKTREYGYEILGDHPATRLGLVLRGNIKKDGGVYQTKNQARYGRMYIPIQTKELNGKIDTVLKELNLEKKDQNNLSFIKGKYISNYPFYKVNGSVLRANELNSTGDYYLNFDDKFLRVSVNTTEDGSERNFYMNGNVPDSRNAIFSMWTDYEDVHVSDIAFYLRLNHSRLVTSNLRWRPELEDELKANVYKFGNDVWNGFFNGLYFWRDYIRSESYSAAESVWRDAENSMQEFLDDVRELKQLQEDYEDFKVYLNNSYNNNEFYIRDIVIFSSSLIDELSIRGHIESLPEIVREIWEIMGETGEAIKKSLLWMIETLKNSYHKAVEFMNSLMRGELMAKISTLLEGLVEKYDKFMKDLHVAFVKYMEELYLKASRWLDEYWNKFVITIEPTFVMFAHYVEAIALKVSEEVMDFLYQQKKEIFESPYFTKVANFTQDLDRLYKDIIKNDMITNIRKYSKIIYEFLKEKYFTMVPFGKELQDIVTEIINEIKVLQKLPSVNYAIQKYNELYDKVMWLYDYLDLGTRIQNAITLIHLKITDITQTALQAENRYREAKTKFIFDPENGYVVLEQKLPMSWHAFNETPRFEEIPEYKAISDLQNYFVTSNTTFWTLYYEYKPYTEPSNWLPPFKGEAMIIGPQHFMTFDRSFYEFEGSCSYLLASDFVDGNFSLILTYGRTAKEDVYYEISLITEDQVVHINVFNDSVRLEKEGIKQLPVEAGDTFIFQEAEMVTIESAKGFSIHCNLRFDICIFSLSGWYYGKTAGLFGTMDNEPTSDFMTPQRHIETNLGMFAKLWAIEPEKCQTSKNFAIVTKDPDSDLIEKCETFFKSKTSQFSSCFARVDSTPFLNMCLNTRDPSGKEPCSIAVAYMKACLIENTPLRIPEACVKCELVNGSQLAEGDFRTLEGTAVPRSTDIVFIIEAGVCNQNIKERKNMDALISTLTKELTEERFISNRFSVVVYGGDGVYNEPRSIVVNNNVFATPQMIPHYFEHIPAGNGSKDIFGAIRYAAKLLFRAGVSKTFILIPCSNCDPTGMTLDYSVLHQVLLESDIKLHILMNDDFKFDKPRIQKIFYGMDGETAYTKKDVKSLKGDSDLRRQVKLPKSKLGFCTALALETNGTVFTAKLLEVEKKGAVKKFVTVLSKRIAKTAVPYSCQTCECTADNNGMSYMECFPCEYPQPAHYNYDFSEEEDYIPTSISPEEYDYAEEEDEAD
ncbi:uncharacterized protein Apoltp [Anabrus simplex]|uniref:uncharacterized protein Apoltp n=1 Tax=Anabrus simplex TaxID=316456 RepID=UPI0035A2BFC4